VPRSLPSADSPVWDDLGRAWPVADDDPAWLYAGFQPFAWTESGVGLPSDVESLAAYIEAGQAYQAWLLRYATDQFRMRKFEPCWGAFAYQLVDPFPSIGFGVVDYARHPKAALAALRQAMAPTRLIIEPLGFDAGGGALRYSPGKAVEARLVVVNDDFDASGPARVRWSLHRERAPDRSGMAFVRDALVRKSFSGSIDFELPAAVEPAVQVAKLSLPAGGEGVYRLAGELLVAVPDGRLDRARPRGLGRALARAPAAPAARLPGRSPGRPQEPAV